MKNLAAFIFTFRKERERESESVYEKSRLKDDAGSGAKKYEKKKKKEKQEKQWKEKGRKWVNGGKNEKKNEIKKSF